VAWLLPAKFDRCAPHEPPATSRLHVPRLSSKRRLVGSVLYVHIWPAPIRLRRRPS